MTDNFRGVPLSLLRLRRGPGRESMPVPSANRTAQRQDGAGGGGAYGMSIKSPKLGGREGLRDRCGCQPIASEGRERGALCVTTVMNALGVWGQRENGGATVGPRARCARLHTRIVLQAAGERKTGPAFGEPKSVLRPLGAQERQVLRQWHGGGAKVVSEQCD